MSKSNILTKKHDENFKTIFLEPIQSYPNLSWKAKGLWAYLISRPEDWEFYLTDIIKRSGDGRTAVKSAMQELKDVGLLRIDQQRNEKGKFYTVWTIAEDPDMIQGPPPENPTPDNPTPDSKQGSKKYSSNKVKSIYNHWLEKSETITHRKLTTPMKKAVKARLKDYSVSEIKKAIDNYNMVVASDNYFFSYNNWALNEFLSREEGKHVEKFLENPDGFKKDDSKNQSDNRPSQMTEADRKAMRKTEEMMENGQ